MRVCLISDTHSAKIELPECDVLIHAGDLTNMGSPGELGEALEWVAESGIETKIIIAGNHDFFCENKSKLMEDWCASKGITYLCETGTDLNGLKVWGSPYTPWFHDWAFNVHRGDDIQRHWDKIPDDVDILATHGPPFGILDIVSPGVGSVGCRNLIGTMASRLNPIVHVFGHIHEGYGVYRSKETLFCNASITNNSGGRNAPFVVEIDGRVVNLTT